MAFQDRYGYSFAAGAFAAGGSFFGKLPSFLTALTYTNVDAFYLTTVLVHLLPLTLMFVCNVMNWRYFLKALQVCDQSLTATVLSAATNYLFSFSLGAIFYREPFTLLSTAGLLLILSGLWFLCGDTTNKQNKKKQ